MKRAILCILLCGLASGSFAALEPVRGDITDVIVYRGQALVTRQIQLDEQTGDLELIVEALPERLLPESLYAQANDGIAVMSVRYREKKTVEDNRQEVLELEKQIAELQNQKYKLTRDRQFSEAMNTRFEKLWQFSLEGADVSVDRAAFSSETMKDFGNYLEEKNGHYHSTAVEQEMAIQELDKQLAELDKELKKLAQGHQTVHREALVYLHKPNKGAAVLELSYLVNNAGWSPQYNLWARPDKKDVRMEYLAVVHQSSGEDWTSASLALSTAQPTLVAGPPLLEPMEVTLGQGPAGSRYGLDIRSSRPATSEMAQQSAESFVYLDQSQQFEDLYKSRRATIAKGIAANEELNIIAISNQMIELEADKRLLQQMQQKSIAMARNEGVSVMYALPGKLTLPSQSDQQLVTIAAETLPAEFTLLATPLLTDYVYLWGQVKNQSDTILLPGPASMYRSGEFVGKGQMDLVTIGQTFDRGFGIDSQVQVVREFKDKKIESLWGNRMDQQDYTITLHNYKNQKAALRLIERIPWTEHEQVEILLTKPSHPLSTDPEYLRSEKDKGILRWDLTLEPETHGPKATVVKYGYTMKYDSDMRIHPVAKAQ